MDIGIDLLFTDRKNLELTTTTFVLGHL